MDAIRKDGMLIANSEQTPEMCLTAVRQTCNALSAIRDQFPELCLYAVLWYKNALEHIRKQTLSLCMTAVRHNGLALEHITKSTSSRFTFVMTPYLYNAICLAAVRENGMSIEYVIGFELSQEQYHTLCLEAVKSIPESIQLIESEIEHMTPEMRNDIYLAAVTRSGVLLSYVKKQSEKICLIAVRENGMSLEHVILPSGELTLDNMIDNMTDNMTSEIYYKICMAAVYQYGEAIQYVKIEYLTPEKYLNICLVAVSSNGRSLKRVDYVFLESQKQDNTLPPDWYYTLCLSAVKNDSTSIEYVDISRIEKDLTVEQYLTICMEAVEKDGMTLRYVDLRYVDLRCSISYYDLCIAAVKNEGYALQYVQECDITTGVSYMSKDQYYKVCSEAVTQDGEAIAYVNNQTDELRELANRSNERTMVDPMLEYSNELNFSNYINQRDVSELESRNRTISEQLYDMYEEIVSFNGLALEFITNQTLNIRLAAVKDNGLALEYVTHQTNDICLTAVKQNCRSLRFVAKQTEEICLIAVTEDGMMLIYVVNKTPAICLAAIKQNSKAIQFLDISTDNNHLNLVEIYRENVFLMKQCNIPMTKEVLDELTEIKYCDICFQDEQPVLKTPCKHELCHNCLMSLPNYMCPFCRRI